MRRLAAVLIGSVLAGSVAAEPPTSSLPARQVTAYALTSPQANWYQRDPSAWRLLASDDGKAWTVLDVQTNQSWTSGGVRRLFPVPNGTAYRIYRLEIDASVAHADREVALAEVELLGPVTGVDREVDLQANITASQEQPLMGAAVNGFDGDLGTTWIDFAPFASGQCWIQCEYVRQSEALLTSVNQVRAMTRLAGPRALLQEKASQIQSNLTASTAGNSGLLTGYALTSGNDYPERDPYNWQLLGSNDGGENWETVDVRRDEIFPSRFDRRVFLLRRPAHYRTYRLQMSARESSTAMQLAEIEPLYADAPKDRRFSLAILASAEYPPMERAEMAFDGDPRSKWLAFTWSPDQPVWIQWQRVPAVEGLPLINLDEFARVADPSRTAIEVPQPGTLARTMTAYSLTSANDEPGRDPRDWRLLGSNDGGKSWVPLDERQHEVFGDRLQKRRFMVARPAPYRMYRFEFSSVAEPSKVTCIQLAGIDPEYAPETTQRQYAVVVSAQGDYAPAETVQNLFDGEPKTKWLDPSVVSGRASWVQWYFANRDRSAVIRSDAASGVQPGLPRVLKLQLRGAAVCASSNLLGLLDETGFRIFELDAAVPGVHPGDEVRLTGQLHFGSGFPRVEHPRLEDLGPLPNIGEVRPEKALGRERPFVFGSADGKVMAVSDGPDYCTVQLETDDAAHLLPARILNPRHSPIPRFAGGRLRVRGVIEPAVDVVGGPFPGIIWVASLADVEQRPAAENGVASLSESAAAPLATNELTSISQIKAALKNEPNTKFNVKVRGVITYIDIGLVGWYLQDGADGMYVNDQYPAGISPFMDREGMYVELHGTVGGAAQGISPTAFVKVLGKGRLPAPVRHSLDYLMAGSDDYEWVQLSGIVTALEKQRLTLSVNGGRIIVWVSEMDQTAQSRLLGSLVRVSGVCCPVFNSRWQRLGIRLLVPSAEYVETVRAVPENPFDLPERSIGGLMRTWPGGAGVAAQLVKVTGVVTYREPRLLFVQNGGDGLRVFTREDAAVEPGDRVSVVGLAEMDGLSPRLVQAVVQKTGEAPLPAANPIAVLGMDSVADEAGRDATRGSVEATVLGSRFTDSAQVLELKQDKTEKTFLAYLPLKADDPVSMPAAGSRVRLQGAFKAKTDSVADVGQVITSFEMYLSSPADIVVLSRPPWWTGLHILWVLGGLAAVLLVALAWAGLLRNEVRRRTRQLQTEIHERQRMETELIAASRQAGMAEVATSVLHNVGNVLNSVNISSSLVAEKLRKSHGGRLAQLAALLDGHSADLGDFLARDAKGRQIPVYLNQLAKQLDGDQAAAISEMDALRQNIEHIKGIVAMQQTYAKVAGVTEVISLTELADEALRINAPTLQRHGVQVIREYAPELPKVSVDRHKVLQILINLITNAKHACAEAGRTESQVKVGVLRRDGRIEISVADNGIGIAPENLTRIFNHGFTTRHDGHGFGLHGGALAAKEMGGTLTAHSGGPGMGATFILQLPV